MNEISQFSQDSIFDVLDVFQQVLKNNKISNQPQFQEQFIEDKQNLEFQNSEKTQNEHNCSSNQQPENDSTDNQRQNASIVQVKRKKRTVVQSSQWTQADELNYWKFYIKFTIQRPFLKISWYTWKQDFVFKLMSKQLGTKTQKQCKARDLNNKRKYGEKMDILDRAVQVLRQSEHDDIKSYQLLRQYEQLWHKKSDHMIMLEQRLSKMHQQQQRVSALLEGINTSY